ncbi:MAG: hypothetical protein CL678_17370 [Bdellovibrionaceae bacterium]|nr:hypothetical protein [Pseudobdellovibrionaceae bacterium]|tara:strand:+ start:3373 stop:4455 length:1083 start_codon:yes stop_codon:yes gene_type:complete
MRAYSNKSFRRDMVKLAIMFSVLTGTLAVFVVTPALSTPTLLSVVITMVISPSVKFLERKEIPRSLAIGGIFFLIFSLLSLAGVIATQTIVDEWGSFVQKAPRYFEEAVLKLKDFETQMKESYPFLESVRVTDSIVTWGNETGQWFISNGPALLGDLFTWMLIVPILSFVLLNDSRRIKKKFFELVPNRFFESTFMVTTLIFRSLSDYVRAKIIEATLVGLIVGIGLWIVGAKYAFVLALLAGVANILPYVGPFIGAAPGILYAGFDPASSHLFIPVLIVYGIANFIDMGFIFPVLVAKLVNLHPLILIAAVILGQQYYGLVGMLISIPIATALKVIVREIFDAVYQTHQSRSERDLSGF